MFAGWTVERSTTITTRAASAANDDDDDEPYARPAITLRWWFLNRIFISVFISFEVFEFLIRFDWSVVLWFLSLAAGNECGDFIFPSLNIGIWKVIFIFFVRVAVIDSNDAYHECWTKKWIWYGLLSVPNLADRMNPEVKCYWSGDAQNYSPI